MTFKEFAEKFGITISSEYADENPVDTSWRANHYKCVLKCEKRQMTIFFSKGFGLSGEPTAEEILNCVAMDYSEEDFEDWCGEYGYDTDSRKAEKVYKACKKQTKDAKRLLGENFDTLLECEE